MCESIRASNSIRWFRFLTVLMVASHFGVPIWHAFLWLYLLYNNISWVIWTVKQVTFFVFRRTDLLKNQLESHWRCNCFNFIIILLNNGGSFTFCTYSPIRINYQMKIKTKWMIVPIVFPCETSIKNRSALRHWWSIQNRIGIKYSKMSKIIVEAICWKIVSHFRMWFGKINVE